MRSITTTTEAILRIFVAAIDIIVLAIAVFNSVRFGQHFIVTYVATCLMALWCAWATCRGWGVFSEFAGPRSVSLKNELFCMSCGEFILLALFIVSTLSVGLRSSSGERSGPYAENTWRMYAVWFQVTLCGLQFGILVITCAGCLTARRRQRTESSAFAMTAR